MAQPVGLVRNQYTTNDDQKCSTLFSEEKRGARKKIKLDASRIHEEKLKIQMAKDQKRKDVTKSILGQLAAQEGDVKKTQKAKYNLFPDL